jgi:hypothetical protein
MRMEGWLNEASVIGFICYPFCGSFFLYYQSDSTCPEGLWDFFEAAVEERLVNRDLEYRARMYEPRSTGRTATGRIV